MNNANNNAIKGKTKGFMMSIVAGSLIILLILFVSLLHNSYLSSERAVKEAQPALYSKFFFDDVLLDVNDIVGPEIRIAENNNTVEVWISDSLPKSNYSSALEEYKSFLGDSFSATVHANITANFSAIEDGSLELFILDDYLYNNSYAGNNEILFGKIENNSETNAISYEINLTTYKNRQAIQDFEWDDDDGDINVTIRYTDMNGTWESSGLLESDETNTFTITFISNETKKVEVVIGEKENNGYEGEGVLWIKDTNASVIFSVRAVLPLQNASTHVRYYYNAMLNYTQANIAKNGMIGNG